MDAGDGLVAALRLALVPGVGPKTRRALLDRFGSAEAVLRAPPSALRDVKGVGTKLSSLITSAEREIRAEEEIEQCRAGGVQIVLDSDEVYPPSLLEIPDPPGVLFVRGTLCPRDAVAVAIVGTRHASAYGLRQAERLGSSLARAGVTVISGLARGIDAAAHRGALGAGGRTIAVLGSGVLNIYPPEHAELAFDVCRQGALISESPPHGEPLAGTFPQRNRVISGLSLGVLVVEAGDRSGALITARHAMEQGRDVFAVPGRIDDRTSTGCHRLIRDGAKLVQSVDDILEELGPLARPVVAGAKEVHHPAELLLNEIEQQVLDAVGSSSTSIDAIITATGLPVSQVLATVSVLEMRRLIRRLSGSTVARI